MKILSVVSSGKYSGKTFLSSLILSSLCNKNYKCSYYKPFQMNVVDNRLPDIDYIKHNSPLQSCDIFCSYGFLDDSSPMFLCHDEASVNMKDIRDTLLDNKDNYDIMLVEGIGIYEPIVAGTTFFDMLINTYALENDVILVSCVDQDVVGNTLQTVEAFYTRGQSIKLIILNEAINNIYDSSMIEQIVKYINENVYPIPVLFMPHIQNKEPILYNKKPFIAEGFERIADFIFKIV